MSVDEKVGDLEVSMTESFAVHGLDADQELAD